MGTTLPLVDGGAPHFAVCAAKDPGGTKPGAPLGRFEMIKGWIDAQGQKRVSVIELQKAEATPPPGADCSVSQDSGVERFATYWTDHDFDPDSLRGAYVPMDPVAQPNQPICLRPPRRVMEPSKAYLGPEE